MVCHSFICEECKIQLDVEYTLEEIDKSGVPDALPCTECNSPAGRVFGFNTTKTKTFDYLRGKEKEWLHKEVQEARDRSRNSTYKDTPYTNMVVDWKQLSDQGVARRCSVKEKETKTRNLKEVAAKVIPQVKKPT